MIMRKNLALSVFAGSLLLVLTSVSQAATVPFSTFTFAFGSGSINDTFSTPVTGTYRATIVDQGVPDHFQTLILAISEGLNLVNFASANGGTSSFLFDATAGDSFNVAIGHITDGIGMGLLSAEVSLIPIPASALLLGSALAGFLVVGRRRALKA
jgi:hypothetical protein